MCGINGINSVSLPLVKKMNKVIGHRGPDDSGTYADKKVTLGQVRLSILDLSPAGKQPFTYTHKKQTVHIVFNGEIYNYKEIQQDLEKKGYAFRTTTDTEVLIASYLEWGEKCVDQFNGMWAFCIYDPKKSIFFCSRDRLGQKPFNYIHSDRTFCFSSEIKALIQNKKLNINNKDNIDTGALQLFFGLGYIPAPFTIYKNVRKLEAAHNLIYDLKKNTITQYKYWSLPTISYAKDKNNLIKKGRWLLQDATRLRMRSDVPVGAFLSGGLDSTAVVGIMKNLTDLKKLHTFSIGFRHKKLDETPFIDIAKNAYGTKHHHYYYTRKDFDAFKDKFVHIYDEPFADFSGYPTAHVSMMAKKHVSVCLSGDGGDEIFGGYHNHVKGAQMDVLYSIPKAIRYMMSRIKFKRNLSNFSSLYMLGEACRASLGPKNKVFGSAFAKHGLKPPFYQDWTAKKMKECLRLGNNSLAEGMRIFDLLYNTLPDHYNQKVDRASMTYALEVRSPFLDYRFAEFGQTIPKKWKQNSFQTKILMRDIIKNIVPEQILSRGKQGFEPPIKDWIMHPNYTKDLHKGVEILRELDHYLYDRFSGHILKENNTMYNIYKIRLYLFYSWWCKWIQ